MPNDKKISSHHDLAESLNERLDDFMGLSSQAALKNIFSKWRDLGWNSFLFGGLLRDLILQGKNVTPRDIDVVVANKTIREIKAHLGEWIQRETRFGGLQVNIAGIRFDIWPLAETWAFNHLHQFPVSLANLPKTTFLNVEGLVSGIPDGTAPVSIFEYGFLDAITSRQLSINLRENPFPALAAIRAVITARRLDFSMSSTLTEYVVDIVRREGIDSLMNAQTSHYREVLITQADLKTTLLQLDAKLGI
jgi:hypothetical protein